MIRIAYSFRRCASSAGLLVLLAGHAAAGRVNFAYCQEVKASSRNGDYAPELAVDGLVSNFHSWRTANTTDPQWLEISWPRAVVLGSAHVYLGLDNDPAKGLTNFRFQYHDGSGWVDVPGGAVTGNTAAERVVIFSAAVTAQRIRLYTDDNGNRVVREVALFPPAGSGGVEQSYPSGTGVRLSLAHQRPAVASSISGGGYARLAVDGYVDDASRWTCTSTAGQTLEVDLLEPQLIGSAHVCSGAGAGQALGGFVLEAWDGTAWSAIPGGTVTGNTEAVRVVPFSTAVRTARVRLRTTVASPGRVRELLVFPPRAGGYPPGQDVVTGPPPSAEWEDFSDSTWRLKNGGPDNRLALVDGTVVYDVPSTPAEAIEWQLLLNFRDGSYRVRHIATGGCLALGEISRAPGTPAVVEAYSGLPHQDWSVEYVSGTQFRLINVYSGLALQAAGGVWAAGTRMVVTTPGSSALQLWNANFRTHYPKKGLAGSASVPGLRGSWSYNWGRTTAASFPPAHTFNPMQWGNFNWQHGDNQGPVDLLRGSLQSSPLPVHVMGYNEPDQAGQANMSVDTAIERWPRLEALEMPLAGPAAASASGGWQAAFTARADALGYRRDFTTYHFYGAPDAGALIAQLQNAYNTFGRPVWLTEFSTVSWSGTGSWTHADNYHFLAEFLWRAESLPWLKRYAVFQFTEGAGTAPDPASAPRSNTWKSDRTLTPFGELYATWDGVTRVLPAKAYHLHNRGGYERAHNPGGAAGPALVSPGNAGAGTQWFLSPGSAADTYQIVSARDGRPLRYADGGAVSLGPAGFVSPQAGWRLVADQDGWYFVEHPATGKRLKDSGSGGFSMVAGTNSGDLVKWRFVIPLQPAAVAPPDAPAPVSAQAAAGAVTLRWSAVPDAESYLVQRSPAAGGPWSTLTTGLSLTEWTDGGLPAGATYFYTVSAGNALGFSAPSAVVSATVPHAYAAYGTWAQQTLGAYPAQEQAATADPDHDRMPNLLEFAFLTDPARAGGNPLTVNRTPAGRIVLEFPWNWRAAGLRWQLRHGPDLSNAAAWPVIDAGIPEITVQGDTSRIRVMPPGILPGRGFFRLEVIAE